jgi:hypothetical protein
MAAPQLLVFSAPAGGASTAHENIDAFLLKHGPIATATARID